MNTAVLKSCSLDQTSRVKKLKMQFFIDQIDPALHLYEAVSFDQLVANSENCLIVYTGPKQIYDSRDKTYCPLSKITNEDPSFYREIRTVNYDQCQPRKSISASFSDLAVKCEETAIDKKSLIKIRQTDNSMVIYCSGFKYSRSSKNGKPRKKRRCLHSVFALPASTVFDADH